MVAEPSPRPDPSQRRAGDVVALVEQAQRWQPFYGPTGRLLWQIPSASSSEVYVAYAGRRGDGSCSCPYAAHAARGDGCKHLQALRLYLTAVRAAKGHSATIQALREARQTAPAERGGEDG